MKSQLTKSLLQTNTNENKAIPYNLLKTNKYLYVKSKLILLLFIASIDTFAQTNPAITSWLQNTNNTKGRYYLTDNSTSITTTIDANVQQVQYCLCNSHWSSSFCYWSFCYWFSFNRIK